ncbi:MAG: hypothetical protein LBP87_13965 [Planctomycetaceae bacterium]|jgi:tetratricopeptide (TPR) repeat protein|nr:hypothetical protein [Planctomycetaceae bacterium]
MVLDPYSFCPGGRDKKVRFCCSDMLKEIEQIKQMLENNQTGACLAFIETLEKNHPDRACLTATKLFLYRAEGKIQETIQVAKNFYEKEPENPIALSEFAIALAVTNSNPKLTISVLIDGFEHSPQGIIHSTVLDAALNVGICLLYQGIAVPVIALCNQLKSFPNVKNSVSNLLARIYEMTELPLPLREITFDSNCPDQFPQKQEFMEAVKLISQMHWKKALAKLEALTQYDSDWYTIWYNVAVLRFWLLENLEGCEALKKYAALLDKHSKEAVPEKIVDVETLRILMTENALGDQIQVLHFTYKIDNANTVAETLLSNPLFSPIPVDSFKEESNNLPPPQNAFLLIDRPLPPHGTPVTINNVPLQLATILVFGKETDRDARIEVSEIWESDRLKVEHVFKETLGSLVSESLQTHVLYTISKSNTMIRPRFIVNMDMLNNESLDKDLLNREFSIFINRIEKEYFEQIFIDRWCKLPFGLFDGKTPNEIANDPAYRVRLLGVIQVLELMFENDLADEVSNLLRKKLGLPTNDTIITPAGSDKEIEEYLKKYAVWHWHRFEAEKLPAAFLIYAFQIVAMMKELRAARKFALELLNRPANTIPIPIRGLAFKILIIIEQNANRFDTALEWIEKAKQETGLDTSVFYLDEIQIRLTLGQLKEFNEAVNYLVTNYSQNENVMRTLQSLLHHFGILNPDGTPNDSLIKRMQNSQTDLSLEQTKIWTPDNMTPNTNPTKLWTPEG